MKKIFYISIGGFFGAMLRFYIKNLNIEGMGRLFPINTFIINITGAFILALLLTVSFEIWEFNIDIRLGIGTGFLGAFTTFSTMCKEIVNLFLNGYYIIAVEYIGLSMILGLVAALLGMLVARKVIAKFIKENDKISILEGNKGE